MQKKLKCTYANYLCKISPSDLNNVFLFVCSVMKDLQTNKSFNKYCNDFIVLLIKKGSVNIIIDHEDFNNLNNHLQNELIQAKVPLKR